LALTISKVDEAKRLVFGWATLDNVDLQGDIVTFDASLSAFEKFRGNIREMHQPIAAGRMIEYRPQQYRTDSGAVYNGIFMSAYVSQGAESTWQKVLDKTLSCFSVRGNINKSRMEFRPDINKTVRVVEDYTMTEVSLVDSGGNELANVVSIVKDVNGNDTVQGDLTTVEMHNVFLCKEDSIVELSKENSLVCQKGHDMKNIGWVEKSADTMEKVNALVTEHISKHAEGGVDVMAEEVKKEVVAVEPEVTEDSAVAVDEAAGAVEVAEEEKPADEEVAPEAADELEKSLSEAIEELRKSTATTAQVEQIMKDVDGKFEAFQSEFAERFTALEKQQEELTKSLTTVTEGLSTMSKSVDVLQDSSANRKSDSLGGEAEGDELSKSNKKPGVWQGSIL